jgi:hypothetical protein
MNQLGWVVIFKTDLVNYEPIIDWLWMLFHKKLPLLYFEYRHLAEDKLENWRALVNEEIKDLPQKRKLLYCPPSN